MPRDAHKWLKYWRFQKRTVEAGLYHCDYPANDLWSAKIRCYRIHLPWLGRAVIQQLWHDLGVFALAKLIIELLTDLAGFAMLSLCPGKSLVAENLLLRRQLALYKERGAKPRRIDAATRMSA